MVEPPNHRENMYERILFQVYSETFVINFEGLGSLLHRFRPFNQIHFDMLCSNVLLVMFADTGLQPKTK